MAEGDQVPAAIKSRKALVTLGLGLALFLILAVFVAANQKPAHSVLAVAFENECSSPQVVVIGKGGMLLEVVIPAESGRTVPLPGAGAATEIDEYRVLSKASGKEVGLVADDLGPRRYKATLGSDLCEV